MADKVKIKRALLSVYNKQGLVEFAKTLQEQGTEIISTGGTARHLAENGIDIISVSDVTGFPEILGGRVKTLHPFIHGAILAKRESNQLDELKKHDITPIDMVVVNLYPFEKTVAQPDVQLADALENIDIGGPCMIRAAAKNFPDVTVVTDPEQYQNIISEIKQNDGSTTLETRKSLAVQAFLRTSQYDSAINRFLGQSKEIFPDLLDFELEKVMDLRYGENPHQQAAFYTDNVEKDHFGTQLHGKELSFNNLLDLHSTMGLAYEFDKACAVIVKHNNPCGVSLNEDLLTAYKQAFASDSVSAFGGVVAFNRPVTQDVAEEMSQVFLEVIVAPKFSDEAKEILMKKKNLRLLEWDPTTLQRNRLDIKKIYGGYLVQNMDSVQENPSNLKIVTERKPTEQDWVSTGFGWTICKWVKSNAIIYVKDTRTLGIGAGQMSRVDSSKLAVQKASEMGHDLKGTIMISDAFFPFRDGIDAAAKAGAVGVVQPGGSIRDQEVIDAANEHNMFMIFTGTRHFRH